MDVLSPKEKHLALFLADNKRKFDIIKEKDEEKKLEIMRIKRIKHATEFSPNHILKFGLVPIKNYKKVYHYPIGNTQSRIVWDNDAHYIGNTVNGIPNGYGIFVYPNVYNNKEKKDTKNYYRYQFNGIFEKGIKSGLGTETIFYGDKIDSILNGIFKNNFRHGDFHKWTDECDIIGKYNIDCNYIQNPNEIFIEKLIGLVTYNYHDKNKIIDKFDLNGKKIGNTQIIFDNKNIALLDLNKNIKHSIINNITQKPIITPGYGYINEIKVCNHYFCVDEYIYNKINPDLLEYKCPICKKNFEYVKVNSTLNLLFKYINELSIIQNKKYKCFSIHSKNNNIKIS